MKLVNKILLTTTLVLPTFGISSTLTSCSNTWGYQPPLHFGSFEKTGEKNLNDPYFHFRPWNSGKMFRDADGNYINAYMQSNYIVDQAKSVNYAYTTPATNWYDNSDKENQHINHTDKWSYLSKNGWKSASSSDVETQVTLAIDKDGEKVNKSFINNMNTNLLKYTNVSGQIASSIAGYLAYALQYQASQINKDDLQKEEDLNCAWGKGSTIGKNITLNHGSRTGEEELKKQNRDFYEFIFSNANIHAAKKTDAYMKAINVNFNYDVFPIPSYNLLQDGPKEDEIDYKDDLSQEAISLLLGHYGDKEIHLYNAGETIESGIKIPAYYSSKVSKSVALPYKDAEGKEQTYANAKCWTYTFTNVPILVHARDIAYTWVDPTVKDSFIPSDFYVKDQARVENAVGDSWKNMKPFISEGAELKPTVQGFNIDTNSNNHIKAQVKKGNVEGEAVWDQRLIQQIDDSDEGKVDGNTFVVLATYNALCYDDPKFIQQYKDDFAKQGKTFPQELEAEYLRRYNVMDIGGITDIFPTYFLALDTSTYTKNGKEISKYTQASKDPGDIAGGFVPGYIINSELITEMNTNLMNLLQRKSGDGFIEHASQVSDKSKELLSFLTYMFAEDNGSYITLNTDNFIDSLHWGEE